MRQESKKIETGGDPADKRQSYVSNMEGMSADEDNFDPSLGIHQNRKKKKEKGGGGWMRVWLDAGWMGVWCRRRSDSLSSKEGCTIRMGVNTFASQSHEQPGTTIFVTFKGRESHDSQGVSL
jgi:hypothetical protein